MSSLPTSLFRRWGHSFEEDAPGAAVYRPADYSFPRARGRGGIEFGADGSFTEWAIGRGDAAQPLRGRWTDEGKGRLRIHFDGDVHPAQTLEVLEVNDSLLRLKQRGA
ncbi:hypothetical protein EJ065_4171 [Corallococcus coralloides]|uniref:Uncharacterized protein n=1 Tax=Corallococcus coralloides TaxID=184914 RepID=A0A410RUY6_CORCK|nr:hypothetical protein EJ065_4171 [Corallococcus coralloides]